jgi:hypothetical protein
MKPPNISDQECIDRIQAAADALVQGNATNAQIVGALTAAILKIACIAPQSNRPLRLAIEILEDADSRVHLAGDESNKIRLLN